MKISKRQLKRIIREEYSRLKRRGFIRESAFESPNPGKITSIAGMDRYGDHRTFFDKVKQAEEEDPGTIEIFVDWAYQAESSTLPEWVAKSREAKWVGMDEIQWENLWHYVQEMGTKAFIKKIMY